MGVEGRKIETVLVCLFSEVIQDILVVLDSIVIDDMRLGGSD